MEEQILKELIRMNKFLEAIDWKLWNFYDASFNKETSIQAPATTLPKDVVMTAPVKAAPADVTTATTASKPIISVPKYPSID